MMSETEKLLEEKIEDYEAAKRAAGAYLEENFAELSKYFCYAEKLSLPVRENQAFFIWDEEKPGAELIKLLLEQFESVCGADMRLVCCDRGVLWSGSRENADSAKEQEAPAESAFSKYMVQNSEEYWEALACSGYLLSGVPLPAAFVKREGQTYFNALSMACGRESFADLDGIAVLPREFLKTDVTLGASEAAVRETWEKTGLLGLYGGSVLLCGDPAEHAREIAEAILGKDPEGSAKTAAKPAEADNAGEADNAAEADTVAETATAAEADTAEKADAEKKPADAPGSVSAGDAGVRRFIPEDTGKKRILVLTAWKMPPEQMYLVKRLLADPALAEYSVTVLSSLADTPDLLADFAALSAPAARVMYRGRMVLDEKEVMTWKMLEKNPDVCVSCPELSQERNRLLLREWRRIWGDMRFDVCLVLGSLGWQQYHMAMAGEFGRRILVDLDYLDGFREKSPARWNRAVTGFDEIFCLPAGKTLGAFGAENKDRVRRLPVLLSQEHTEEVEILKYGGREYAVCGSQKEGVRRRLDLLELPARGAVLGRGGFHMDERFWKYLYFLPAADCFFERISSYIRTSALEYDAAAEICGTRGIPILSPEEEKEVSSL